MTTCKFCGAAFDHDGLDKPYISQHYKCGSYHINGDEEWADQWLQSTGCMGRDAYDLKLYREMFPVVPWCEAEITPEICEKLGMTRRNTGDGSIASDYVVQVCDGLTEVTVTFWTSYYAPTVEIGSTVNSDFVNVTQMMPDGKYYNMTAGQLACLVASGRCDAANT